MSRPRAPRSALSRPRGEPGFAPRRPSLNRIVQALCCIAAPASVFAQATPAPQLAPVVVTATRTDARPFDIPASIDRIDGDDVRDGRAQINISESLGGVPGLVARDRQNYAQDVQISVRGFGARSSFGIRGVRLYVDGIPATLPDGQGQISNVDLGSVDRIEVLRGPFSSLYGNSSGGVIQVFTEEGRDTPRLGVTVAGGSDGALRLGTKVSGATGAFGYVASVSRFRTDGYRDHSETTRTLGNMKLTLRPDAASKVTLVVNSVALPEAQDPLGLSRAQYEANPRGVDPSATTFNTRKSVDQTQGGLTYERRIGEANTLQLMAYTGHRGTDQYQSIPVATQANPRQPGGVIDLAREYRGADLRWTYKTDLVDAPFSIVGGLAYDTLDEHRRGFLNFTGIGAAQVLGVQGALRRDEKNDVSNFDQYVQASWKFAPRWTLNAGVRHSKVDFKSTDAYIVGPNPDDSGRTSYGATLPVVGLMFAATESVHLYATAGRGFETPTLNELAYRAGGATGLNLGLQAARSNSVEAGIKTRLGAIGELNVAAFHTRTENEIVTETNQFGRATFKNAGATRRTGLEAGWSTRFGENLRAQAAYTWIDATYRDGFTTCSGVPCVLPTPAAPAGSNLLAIPAGNKIPGIARSSLFAALSWAPRQGLRGGVEARYLSRVFVNDQNTDAAAGYAIAAANFGYALTAGPWELGSFVRVDNLFDRRYAGSVIVNDGNGRFFEPAPGRTWLASATATLRF